MDDSVTARHALEHALSVFPDAEVTVFHAVDDLEALYGGRLPTDADPAEAADPAFFEDVARIAGEYGAVVETVVREGTAAEAILEYAAETDVDAIVVGSEGRSGVSRVLLGSVAEAVARRSPVPVTIVPG